MLKIDKHVGMQAHEVGYTAFATDRTCSLVMALMRLRLDPAGCILALDLEVCLDPCHAQGADVRWMLCWHCEADLCDPHGVLGNATMFGLPAAAIKC